jgi:hypothetical protein
MRRRDSAGTDQRDTNDTIHLLGHLKKLLSGIAS